MPNQDFSNAKKLPPYIFGQINLLKQQARLHGEDIIDFGMGNPSIFLTSDDGIFETVALLEISVFVFGGRSRLRLLLGPGSELSEKSES